MTLPLVILTVFIAIQHFIFFLMESVLWTQPMVRKVFGLKKDFAEKTKMLAANQGIYNLFLVAGLVWSLVIGDPVFATSINLFFMFCVALAGVFGAITVGFKLFWIQGLPAFIAVALHVI